MVAQVSIKHGAFSGAPRNSENSDGEIVAVILRASPTAKVYYQEAYSPDTQRSPTCWTLDTTSPSDTVPKEDRQSYTCIDCPHNIKGSAANGGKSCRFLHLLALVFPDDLSKVYRIQIPTASIFGKTFDGKMPLREYSKVLDMNEMDSHRLYTRLYFDETSDTPRVCFAPHRALSIEELNTVEKTLGSDPVLSAISVENFVSEAYSGSPFEIAGGGFTATDRSDQPEQIKLSFEENQKI